MDTLEEILPNVPLQRRIPGIKLRFLSTKGWKEYIYVPRGEENDWTNPDCWREGEGSGVIDGGEW